MKVPTDGTKVFAPVAYTGTGVDASITTGFPVDFTFISNRGTATSKFVSAGRLTANNYLLTSDTSSEANAVSVLQTNPFDSQTSVKIGSGSTPTNASGSSYVLEGFRRAPSCFDEVCYLGNGTARTISHNLQAVPQLIISKNRNLTGSEWYVYSEAIPNTKYLYLNRTDASYTGAIWNNTTPTSSVFSVGSTTDTNGSGYNYVAYLFATCAGVSKVGSYTGTGTTLSINCGFTSGARFVLIRRVSSTGEWYVWDSARGIVAGNDPYLRFNSTAAETTTTDYIDPYSAGFEISSSAPVGINGSGGTFIYLAIA
jgi:hypothetical protein